MATEGQVPLFGFKAAAIYFVTLLGFSANPTTAIAALVDVTVQVRADVGTITVGTDVGTIRVGPDVETRET